MKVAIIFLDYARHEYTQQVCQQNFNNAGHDFTVIEVDRKGISAALNEGLIRAKGFDAVVTMANDILMPNDWLAAMVKAAEAIPNTGMCGIYCVEGLPTPIEVNGVLIHPNDAAFGNALIPMKAVAAVGYFNEDFDPYGMQDSDYGIRLKQAGFISYYLNGFTSTHIGHDVGSGTEYRKMKDEGLALAGEKWAKWTKRYMDTGDYTINMPEYPDFSELDKIDA